MLYVILNVVKYLALPHGMGFFVPVGRQRVRGEFISSAESTKDAKGRATGGARKHVVENGTCIKTSVLLMFFAAKLPLLQDSDGYRRGLPKKEGRCKMSFVSLLQEEQLFAHESEGTVACQIGIL